MLTLPTSIFPNPSLYPHPNRRDADFMPWEDLAEIKIMEGSSYMRLYLSLAERLNVMPCEIRLVGIWVLVLPHILKKKNFIHLAHT
jgi:hypothetical protein